MQKLHAKLLLYPTGVLIMSKLVRIVVQLPVELKEQLDALKQQGYTTSGFIRATLGGAKQAMYIASTTRKAVTK